MPRQLRNDSDIRRQVGMETMVLSKFNISELWYGHGHKFYLKTCTYVFLDRVHVFYF